MRLMF